MIKVFYTVCLILVPQLFISCSKDNIDFKEPIQENNIDIQKLLYLVNDVRSKETTCGSTY